MSVSQRAALEQKLAESNAALRVALDRLAEAEELIEYLRTAPHCPAHGFGLNGGGRGCHCRDRATPSELHAMVASLKASLHTYPREP